jgi:hypothetical protein
MREIFHNNKYIYLFILSVSIIFFFNYGQSTPKIYKKEFILNFSQPYFKESLILEMPTMKILAFNYKLDKQPSLQYYKKSRIFVYRSQSENIDEMIDLHIERKLRNDFIKYFQNIEFSETQEHNYIFFLNNDMESTINQIFDNENFIIKSDLKMENTSLMFVMYGLISGILLCIAYTVMILAKKFII